MRQAAFCVATQYLDPRSTSANGRAGTVNSICPVQDYAIGQYEYQEKYSDLSSPQISTGCHRLCCLAVSQGSAELAGGEDLLAQRGIIVSHQKIRKWGEAFRRQYANKIRRRSAGQCDGKRRLDEAVVSIQGQKHWLWRAVDHDGFVLEVLFQSRRNAKATERLMRKSLSHHGEPSVIVTEKLRSYGTARKKTMPGVVHRSHKG